MAVFPLNNQEGAVVQDLILPGGEDVYHVTYGVKCTGLTAGNIQSVADDLHDAFEDNIVPMLSSGYSMGALRLNGMIGGVEYAAIHDETTVGGGGATALPPNCALLLRKRTALAGHSGVGAMYLPGCVDESEVSIGGYIIPLDLTTKQTAVDAWLADVAALPIVDGMALLHRSTGNAADILVSLTAQRKVATQHRRFNGR